MATTSGVPSWSRPQFAAGGGNPRLFFKVHGNFGTGLHLSPDRYGSKGVPAGCTLQMFDRQRHANVMGFGLDGLFAEHLRKKDRRLFDAVLAAPQCIVLRGEIDDPSTLDYLRDTVGLIMALIDAGGLAVFDPLILEWWSPAEWKSRLVEAGGPAPRHHAVVLIHPEGNSQESWVHTRGMLKFGRPDISARQVPRNLIPAVQDLCNRFIEMLAAGAVIPDGQEVRMDALPGVWRCSHEGESDDPDFNNVHIELRRTSSHA